MSGIKRKISLNISILVIISFGYIYGYIEISSDKRTYVQLSTYCIHAIGRSYIEFWVKASTDAHVALMTDDLSKPRGHYSQINEIVIGGGSNKWSCIRNFEKKCREEEFLEILNGTDYVQLWINWDNESIQLGEGPKTDEKMVVGLNQSKPCDVKYLAVMTHYSSSWRFYEDTDCRFEEFNNTFILKNDTTCNGRTNYTCESGYRLTSGNLSRVCGIGQQWMGEPPVCSAILSCPEIRSTSVVTVLNQSTQIGGILSMACAHLHVLVAGDLLRTCLPNATWDGVGPVCKACLCPTAANRYLFNSTEERIARTEGMAKELKVKKKETKAFIRSKISVKDNRTSSTGIGVLLGWGIIVSSLLAICLCDAPTLLRHIRHGV